MIGGLETISANSRMYQKYFKFDFVTPLFLKFLLIVYFFDYINAIGVDMPLELQQITSPLMQALLRPQQFILTRLGSIL